MVICGTAKRFTSLFYAFHLLLDALKVWKSSVAIGSVLPQKWYFRFEGLIDVERRGSDPDPA
jgi:hypothetical protein